MNFEKLLKTTIEGLQVNHKKYENLLPIIEDMKCMHHKMGINTTSLSILFASDPIVHPEDCSCGEDNHFIVEYEQELFVFMKLKSNDFYKIYGNSELVFNNLMQKLRERESQLKSFL